MKIEEMYKQKRPLISFEIFPPKRAEQLKI